MIVGGAGGEVRRQTKLAVPPESGVRVWMGWEWVVR